MSSSTGFWLVSVPQAPVVGSGRWAALHVGLQVWPRRPVRGEKIAPHTVFGGERAAPLLPSSMCTTQPPSPPRSPAPLPSPPPPSRICPSRRHPGQRAATRRSRRSRPRLIRKRPPVRRRVRNEVAPSVAPRSILTFAASPLPGRSQRRERLRGRPDANL